MKESEFFFGRMPVGDSGSTADLYLKRSARKSMAIEIRPDGTVLIRAPYWLGEPEIRRVVREKRAWIAKTRQEVRAREVEREALRQKPGGRLTQAEIQDLADEACRDLPARVGKYAPLVGVTYGRITIRCQKTRWGSCSAKGNLNFNCLLMLAPETVRDYVVVHELCHRLQMNHAPAFWREVARVMPDYQREKAWLEAHGGEIMARVFW